ncbi:TraX family protein [Calothrix rhizosoleniae]|uniref:TraX family protein n=1 Tax=Calothrix rhizosoleniae TaxID=888997 RepID=UPI000B49D622|nr:TraX family protein [Calothrix rhizosoleniae]
MTSFDIKIIAFIFMFIDHIGRLFFPDVTMMVAVGRLSFPLFAWLAAMGEKHTSDITKYVTRLILLGIISQPIYEYIYYLMFDTKPKQLNILFTLAAGVLMIRACKPTVHAFGKIAIAVTILFFVFACYWSNIPCLEGGAYGLTVIFLMSIFNYQTFDINWWIVYIAINLFYWYFLQYPVIELMGILAPLFIILYNEQRGVMTRWLYAIYPLHFAALALIKMTLR